MNILKRPPGDQFTFRLFFQLVNKIKQPKDLFYLWSVCFDPNYKKQIYPWITEKPTIHFSEPMFYENETVYRNAIKDNIKNNLVILGIKDHLTSGLYNPTVDRTPDMAIWLKQLAQYYPDKRIVIFTSLENLVLDEPNVDIIPWGGDITNHQKEYVKLDAIESKNYDSRYNYLSLNRNPRPHRVMLMNKLRDLKLTSYGMISCMFKEQIIGLRPNIEDGYEIYTDFQNDNTNNFENKLAKYYQNTFVEIVSETSYMEPSFNLTEKTLNSIYGKSFPIMLSSSGTVKFLRDMGIDMFDDIINHNYDKIDDPSARLHRAITDNKDLLTNNRLVKELHKANEHRFIKNIDFVKNEMYNFYVDRATTQFLKVLNDNNIQN
jgi:hypothetical protein